ncbi:sensor histidine kinase KdpD [uncultured Lutibacter sp.]|uniref:sensor histidine kinase n=1 Tax=uncultured Lutibacter sp. TaxID=437739 RepID=UPI0026305D18|nr:HAMP domain-containing sensor histidine kinase [uncultured Lutibacter sp.]
MGESKKNSEVYINELEEKIVDLSLRLKGKTSELNSVRESNTKSIGKLIHNLRNPVGVIFSFTDMILEDLEEYTPEKLEKHLQIIKNSASFSLELLTIVAKYSQLQSPNLTYSFQSLNYTELVNDILNEFNAISVEKNIKIEREFSKNPISLTIDVTEFAVSLRNIINNAFRYSNNNTTIKITIKENLNTVETIIIDEGIGISEDNLPAIFNEFFVVNTYSEDKQKCIGLGLAITNKIIQDHKGTISVTSLINKGTQIKIILPKK